MALTQPGQAKDPLTPLAGPYGHPFHPILVTLPIGAWVMSLVFDVASHRADQPEVYARGAYWLIGLGVLGAAAAALFGLLDWLTIPRGTRARTVGLAHMVLNLTTTALFAVGWFLRRDEYEAVETGYIALSVGALVLLSVSGWLGGMLAYRYGVRVAREVDQAEGFRPR